MKEIIVPANADGKRLDRFLASELPALPMGLRAKFLRLKRFRVNGKVAAGDTRLQKGDRLNLYIGDEFFAIPKKVDPFLSKIHPKLDILFENGEVMIVDKRPGLVSHPDREEKVHTLITYAQAYLYQKGEFDSMNPEAFRPALVNRIDRFTGGIVLIAKTEAAMNILSDKIRNREVEKRYLCAVHGAVFPPKGMFDNYILKNTRRVSVFDQPQKDAQRAQTLYRTVTRRKGLSLMDCELLTGRTHQIRAQFAHAGHPLLGDSQYGDPKRDIKYHRNYQALYCYEVAFHFKGDAGVLNDLNERRFCVWDVPFAREYFDYCPNEEN